MSVERVASSLGTKHLVFHCYFDSMDFKARGHSPGSLVVQAARMLYNRDSVARFKQQIKASRPDVILMHNIFPVGSIGVYLAALSSGIPVLHYIHNFRPFSVNGYLWGDNRMIRAGLRKNFIPEILAGSWQESRLRTAWYAVVIWLMHAMGIYRRMSGWLAISHFMKQTFVEAGIPEEKIFVLRHSWDVSARLADEASGAAAAEAGGPYLLFLGRLTEAKGLRILMEAWKQVEQVRPGGRLVVGGEGPMTEWMADQQAQLARLEFRGFVSGVEKEQLLRGCRAMVVPSVWWEPLGLVVYEAYQYCRPVIAANSGGLTETVMDGSTGWLYEPNEVEALKNCLLAALDDRAEADARGAAGRTWVENQTGHELWIRDFECIADEVIHRHQASHAGSDALAPDASRPAGPRMASFSIVTPSFRQLELLQRCALSVADQVGQFTVEHLVQDGLSGADFDSWAAAQTVATCRSEADGGMYDAINRGFASAKGEIVAWLNCDEQYLPDTLSKVAGFFASHPEVDILFGDIVVVAPDGQPIGYRQAVKPMPGHIKACFLSTFSAATFLRRKVIDDGHLLDVRYRAISDAVWIEELIRSGYRCQVLNEPLAVFTQTGSNLGQSTLAVEEGRQWRKATGAEGWMRRVFWSTLHRVRKLWAGAYRSRRVRISIHLNDFAGRKTRRATVTERWTGKLRAESAQQGAESASRESGNQNADPSAEFAIPNLLSATRGGLGALAVSSTAPGPAKPADRAGSALAAAPIRITAYLADQNPGHDRSFGISRMSQVVLEGLQAGGQVEIATIASRSSQQAPGNVALARIMPWGTRGKWVRLLTDHFHPLFGHNGFSPDLHYFPKGYLPLLDRWCRPSVVTIHDTIIQHDDDHYPLWRTFWEYTYWAMMLKHTLRRAGRILTVSESSKEQIHAFMDRHWIARKEITVTYEPCLYESIPQPLDGAKENYVIHLASCEPHKRTAHLIRWWHEAESLDLSLPMLHLIGTVPPEVLPLLTSARTIVKQPFLEEAALQAAYRSARALILPSEIEGFGLPALEAYYLGTPVCYVRGTSVDEILGVATRKGGFALESAASLFDALEEVMAMGPDEIHACGLKLREVYAARKVAAKMLEVFEAVKAENLPS